MAENLKKQEALLKSGERRDLRAELDQLEVRLNELKIQFEQYFTGILPLPPDAAHANVKRQIRSLLKAPFRNAALNYRLKALETRYRTFHTYWQRVLKQKEDGTYSKDLFKAELRERIVAQEERAQTAVGKADSSMHHLFDSYRTALEKETGKKHEIDFGAFKKSLLQRAKDFKEKSGAKKLSFKIVVKEGKVSVQIKTKNEAAPA